MENEKLYGIPNDAAMEKISAYTKKTFSPEELFIFTVTLCDNDIDRDGERFTNECLSALVPLMKGRTGICDHEPKAENQTARLYDCYTVTDDIEKNSLNEPLVKLVGHAYMLRTEKNRDVIAEIEGGIRKEVSISCSVKKQICSVCGKDVRICGHIKNRRYGESLCYAELNEPVDGYEWSFVAIPAQKNAGVTKSKSKDVKILTEEISVFKSIESGELTFCDAPVTLTEKEALALSSKMRELTLLAKSGEAYLSRLREEVSSLGVKAGFSLKSETYSKLSEEELISLKSHFTRICEKEFPLKPQTACEAPSDKEISSLDGYKI